LAGFQIIENNILCVIGEKYGLGLMDSRNIDHGDLVMLATEKRDVLNAPVEWDIELPEPLLMQINPWPAETAKELFLDRAKELEII
jgi:hypothetical protein